MELVEIVSVVKWGVQPGTFQDLEGLRQEQN